MVLFSPAAVGTLSCSRSILGSVRESRNAERVKNIRPMFSRTTMLQLKFSMSTPDKHYDWQSYNVYVNYAKQETLHNTLE